ncbi:IpaB/EvcA family protein [Escherichia coli M605]|uniref:IpaB/EvcA family protein n=1 Tax=Escherichia coli M605 TaxID=656417 RepID=F4SY66_ECOLX|nr:hypothetical protein [Escherichia coli]EGI16313.1 IpaB/EvcA family protein [Escherichia coli M605]
MTAILHDATKKLTPLTSKQINVPDSAYEINITRHHTDNFIKHLLGIRNTYIKIQGNSRNIKVNQDKIVCKVERFLKGYISDTWKQQESEVYIPALINKELDVVATKCGRNINSSQRDKIRSKILNKTHLTEQFKNIKTLNSAAQTSIGQVTATYVAKNNSLRAFFKAEGTPRELQSVISGVVTNKIADKVYERVMGQSVNNIREIAQQEARNELIPHKQLVITDSVAYSADK